MRDALIKWAVQLILGELSKWLTPQRVEEWKKQAIALLRDLAKNKTPDFPFDDQLVEAIAKALNVP